MFSFTLLSFSSLSIGCEITWTQILTGRGGRNMLHTTTAKETNELRSLYNTLNLNIHQIMKSYHSYLTTLKVAQTIQIRITL
jgi:hypothetical protein